MSTYDVQRGGVVETEPSTATSVSYYYKGLVGLGAAHVLCGIAALGLGIANAIICGMFGSIGYGIWGSIFYFIAGATAIGAAISQTRCAVVTHLIFALIAAATACVQLGFGVGAAVADYVALKSSRRNEDLNYFLLNEYSSGLDYFFRFGCSDKQRNTYWTYQATGPTVTDSLLASFAIFEGIVALLSAIWCCRICVCPPGITWMAWQPHHASQLTIVTKT